MIKLLATTAALTIAIATAATAQQPDLLSSLPAKAQKRIAEQRAACKEAEAQTTSGDIGLTQFMLGGKLAVLIDPPQLCGGCSAGLTCTNRGTRLVEIYRREGAGWVKVLNEDSFTGDLFLSYRPGFSETASELEAIVASVYYREAKDCPTKIMESASAQSWEARTCVVRWQNGKFNYKPL